MATVEYTQVPGHVVSTISLSVNHGTADAPLWYETMVFVADGDEVADWGEKDGARYADEAAALAGHAAMVVKWQDGEPRGDTAKPTLDDGLGLLMAQTFARTAETILPERASRRAR